MTCPICNQDGATWKQWDFGRDSETGYHDAGEELDCPNCGVYVDKEIGRAIEESEVKPAPAER